MNYRFRAGHHARADLELCVGSVLFLTAKDVRSWISAHAQFNHRETWLRAAAERKL